MGGSSPPPPTPPRETSAAQTGANISTAIANNMMGNANLISADGSTQKTAQTGTYTFTDPYTNMSYDIPTFTRTEALSPVRQQTLEQSNQANLNLATLGANTSKQLIGSMQKQLTADDLGPRPELGAMQRLGSGPQMGRVEPIADMERLGAAATPQMRYANQGPSLGLMGEGSVPNLRTSYVDDFSADRSRVEDALFSRLNPKLQQDRSALETQLSNQGIKLGSAAYDRAMGNFGQQSNDARMAAIMAGGQEQSRLAGLARDQAVFGNDASGQQFSMRQARQGFDNSALQQMGDNDFRRTGFNNMADQQVADNEVRRVGFNNSAGQADLQNRIAATGFNNSAGQQMYDNEARAAGFNNSASMDQFNAGMSGRAQRMQEAFALDNQPVNKAMALASGTQVANPQFQPFNVSRIPTTDNAGIIQNYDQQNFQRWQAEEQQNQRMMGGLMGLGGAALGMFRFSDERLKEDIEPVGTLKGHKLYEYTMKDSGEKQIGVMAQEVRKKRPDAVKKDPESGYLKVNYGALFNAGKKGAR
jgi:hypothetical protein